MERQEFRAAGSLAAVFSVRLLGLFMIYPVFAAYASNLSGANPYLIGEALGIYGLSQGLLQIPFGLLSDRLGRKVMIVLGLILFGIGSAVAALSTSISGVIIGRALQGSGAIGSVILALVADLTTEDNRTKAMAVVGISIGASFMIALVTGPVIADFVGVSGIFWLMVGLALVGIAITEFAVPNPGRVRVHRDAEAVPALIGSVLRNKELLRLDFGVFALHAMLTANFLVVPGLIARHAGRSGPRSVDRLFFGASGFGRRHGAGDHRCREVSPHEGRIREFGCRARGQRDHALSRRRQFICLAGCAHRLLLGIQRDGGEPAVAHHQGGAARHQGHRHGRLFERAVPRHLCRRRRRRLGASARRQPRGFCADGGHCARSGCSRRPPWRNRAI